MSNQTEAADPSVGKHIAKATGLIIFAHMGWKLLGLIEKPLMANFFGTGSAADAFTAASRLILSIFYFVEQLLTHSFMPTFIQTRTGEGEKQAWRLGSTVLNVILMLFALIGALTFVFAPQIVRLTTDFEDQATTQTTVLLLRIMAPAAVILPVTSLTYVILNAYKIFGLPAAADAAFKSGTVLALLFLAKSMGAPALALGIILGTLIKLGMHLFGLRRKLPLYRPVLDLKYPPVRAVGVLALPLMVGNLLSIIRPVLDNLFASGVGLGAVAALSYGRALVDAPAQIFPYALRIALFPFISEMAARGDREKMTEMLVRCLRIVAVGFVPLTVGMLMLRYPIIQTIYQWGKFKDSSTDLVAPVMAYFTLGLLAMAAEMILLEPYFALSDTVTPTKIGIFTFFVHVGLAWAGIQYLGMGVGAVALAYTLSRTLKVIILALGLRRRLSRVAVWPLLLFLAKLGVSVALMAVAIQFLLAHPVLNGFPGKRGDILRLMVPGAAGAVVFAAGCSLLRLDEASYLWSAAMKKLRRKPAA